MKKTTLLILFAILFNASFAQKTIKEWAELSDKKFFKKTTHGTGIGHIKRLMSKDDKAPKLEKVGVLGLSIFQPTYSDKTPYSIVTPYLTSSGSVFFADLLYKPALESVKKSFAESNIELLLPAEYLNTEEKKKLYNETEFELSKLFKASASISNRIRGGQKSDVKANVEGYKFIISSFGDAKVWRKLGQFAENMELDAVLVFETTLMYDGKNLFIQNIESHLVGPNPIPYKEEHKKQYAPVGPLKGRLEGITYGYSNTYAPKGWILLAKLKKGNMKESYFEGIDIIYGRIAKNLIDYTFAEFAELEK